MPADFELDGRRALVTGATGFIGGRLVEALVTRHGVKVRALVRNFTKAPRLARYDVELLAGDVAREADVQRAAAGCELIFHCAYGNRGSRDEQRRGTVDSTRFLLDAAAATGARLVNVSTLAVYGPTADGDLSESSPRPGGGDVYSDSKLEAEGLCRQYARERGVFATSLQPAVVYGPFGPAWTLRILSDLARWRVILVDGGTGLCNAVYVDDVVEALLLAASHEAARGEEFLIAAEEPVTWKEFFGRHEALLGFESTVSLPFEEARARFAAAHKKRGLVGNSVEFLRTDEFRWRLGHTLESSGLVRAAINATPRAVKRGVKRLVLGERQRSVPAAPSSGGASARPDKPIQLLPEGALAMMRARTRVRIDKARAALGYRPRYDFERGFARTAAWARWAGLAPAAAPDQASAAHAAHAAKIAGVSGGASLASSERPTR
jgi:nucleoside-diphosphate-sugar epimerase